VILEVESAVVALVSVRGPVDATALSPEELALVEGASSSTRRQELLAGRAAVRSALRAVGRPAPRAVLSGLDGRPQLLYDASIVPPAELPSVSIAHDGSWAAAAVSMRAVGVDLAGTSRQDRVMAVIARLVAQGRALAVPPTPGCPFDPALMTWTAWEALGKRTGEGVLPAMTSVISAPRREGGRWIARSTEARLTWFDHDDVLGCTAVTLSE